MSKMGSWVLFQDGLFNINVNIEADEMKGKGSCPFS